MNFSANLTEGEPPVLDTNGDCTRCGLDPVQHIRHGNVVTLREAHRDDTPTGRYADEVAVA